MTQLPAYLMAMVRRATPAGAPVVPGSTPVPAFGDPRVAEVATLGINPSKVEFVEKGRFLTGRVRRLATLESLGAGDLAGLSDAQVTEVVADCARYFAPDRNPYRRWFGPLDRLLVDGLGTSFYDGTACHLDLVQWATDPIWSGIGDAGVRRALLEEGVPHLRTQLRQENIRLVLLNGRTVLDQVQRVGLAELAMVDMLSLGRTTCSLYTGTGEGVRFLGWSTNLQSSRGVSTAFKAELVAWLADLGTNLETTNPTAPPTKGVQVHGSALSVDANGYLAKGTTVRGKQQLADLLDRWLKVSNAATIGNVGAFGGSLCVRIQLGDATAVLNADTKRTAVADYVRDVRRRGSDVTWYVIANHRGRVNKVLFREDG